MIKKINWKKVMRKALHTFWQSFLATFVITEYTKEGLKIALVASLLSAIKTTALELLGGDNNGSENV